MSRFSKAARFPCLIGASMIVITKNPVYLWPNPCLQVSAVVSLGGFPAREPLQTLTNPAADHAYFEGKCVVQQFDSNTRELIMAQGNYQFRVDVWDNDQNGGQGIYQIRVLDKNGQVYYRAGFSPVGYLQGGTVTIHKEIKK